MNLCLFYFMEEKNDELPKFERKMNTLCLIVLGMAGSGKTTFVKKLEEHLNENEKESYIINMDPAVINTFYEANMDIRDTINYKEMMKSHNLGPNGSIMTCLNIFATQIHKIVDVLSKKDSLE
jgi:GTPase SAR1 family protein